VTFLNFSRSGAFSWFVFETVIETPQTPFYGNSELTSPSSSQTRKSWGLKEFNALRSLGDCLHLEALGVESGDHGRHQVLGPAYQ
jgi:hypothetical protein